MSDRSGNERTRFSWIKNNRGVRRRMAAVCGLAGFVVIGMAFAFPVSSGATVHTKQDSVTQLGNCPSDDASFAPFEGPVSLTVNCEPTESSAPPESSTSQDRDSTPPQEESTPPDDESTPPDDESTPPDDESTAPESSSPPESSTPPGSLGVEASVTAKSTPTTSKSAPPKSKKSKKAKSKKTKAALGVEATAESSPFTPGAGSTGDSPSSGGANPILVGTAAGLMTLGLLLGAPIPKRRGSHS